jgi:hypothetical protein
MLLNRAPNARARNRFKQPLIISAAGCWIYSDDGWIYRLLPGYFLQFLLFTHCIMLCAVKLLDFL